MENASKALLMAGGILIALLIIAVLVYTFGTMSNFFKEQQTEEEIEQLTAFNNQYEAYNRKLLRGTDVVSVINKAISNNEKYGPNGYNETNYLIQVEFQITDTMGNLESGKTYGIEQFNTIKRNEEDFKQLKEKIFDCKEVRYHATTGRVNYILFVERKQNTRNIEKMKKGGYNGKCIKSINYIGRSIDRSSIVNPYGICITSLGKFFRNNRSKH